MLQWWMESFADIVWLVLQYGIVNLFSILFPTKLLRQFSFNYTIISNNISLRKFIPELIIWNSLFLIFTVSCTFLCYILFFVVIILNFLYPHSLKLRNIFRYYRGCDVTSNIIVQITRKKERISMFLILFWNWTTSY